MYANTVTPNWALFFLCFQTPLLKFYPIFLPNIMCIGEKKKFPIVITVNGGAWIIGSYFWNFLLARLLSARGYVVFCPDYRNFPQTNMEGMVLDVSDAIVRGLVKHFDRRGLYRSVFQKIAGGRVNLPRYSLNSYFDEKRRGETGETLPENIFDFLPKRMFFIHGDADCSAPASESANIAYLMRNAQHARLAFCVLTN